MAFLSKIFVNNASVYNPVLLLSILGGAATVRKKNTSKNVPELRFSPVFTLISFILLIVSLVHVCYIPRGILHLLDENEVLLLNSSNHKLTDVENLDQDYIVKLLNPLSVSLSGIITRITTLLTMNPHIPRIVHLLDKTDRILQTNQNYIVQDGKIVTAMVFFMVLLCIPCQMLSNFGLSKNRLFVTLMFFFNSMNNFCSACAEFQFVSLSFILFRRFKYINKKLETYAVLENNEYHTTFYSDFRKVQPMAVVSNFYFPNASNKKGLAEFLTEISTLHRSFRRLCDILDEIDSYFSFQLLLSIAECNLNVLINLYFAIFGGYYKPEDKSKFPQSTIDILNDFIWGMYYAIRFFGMTLFASLVVNECKKTKVYVSKLQSRALDEASKEELNIMLQYCSNRKPKITACGFFKIDLPLITSAVSTACTYLVIMAQFNSDKQKFKAPSSNSTKI